MAFVRIIMWYNGNMKKVKKLIVGNWKMNPVELSVAKKLAGDIKRGVRAVKKTQTVICPPVVYLSSLASLPTQSLFLGVQDVFYEPYGSYTGYVSFSQVLDFKVSHVIIGHSERRARGETDDMVNKKVRAVLGEGITAIVCIGEESRDKEGNYLLHLKRQILHALTDISKKSFDRVVIAYEPIFSIGAAQAMNPREIHEVTIYIKKILRDAYGALADSVRILYGGAVDTVSAPEIVRDGFVDGLLIGRASLKAKDFVQIIKDIDTL
jgi:triosephosphate isomerase